MFAYFLEKFFAWKYFRALNGTRKFFLREPFRHADIFAARKSCCSKFTDQLLWTREPLGGNPWHVAMKSPGAVGAVDQGWIEAERRGTRCCKVIGGKQCPVLCSRQIPAVFDSGGRRHSVLISFTVKRRCFAASLYPCKPSCGGGLRMRPNSITAIKGLRHDLSADRHLCGDLLASQGPLCCVCYSAEKAALLSRHCATQQVAGLQVPKLSWMHG